MKLTNAKSLMDKAISEFGFTKFATVMIGSIGGAFITGVVLINAIPNNPKY